MNATELTQAIDERCELVDLLMEMGLRQQDAIAAGHMSSLMHLLSQKQELLDRLFESSQRTRVALQDGDAAADWASDAQRDACRQRHQLSEAKLAELLRLEAECERQLQSQRGSIGEQLLEFGNSQRAVSGYAKSGSVARSGSCLDLSSDQ